MQTQLADWIKNTPAGREADAILRKCVHCGFCLATCPTYNLLGDELDSPRGRIYLMKQMLEGAPVTSNTQLHLDRCLTCRACESTCPSGVEYGRLVDIGRHVVEEKVPRPAGSALHRRLLRTFLLTPALFGAAVALGRLLRPLLPQRLARQLPARSHAGAWPSAGHARKMLVLQGCVQPSLAPDINAATARVLDRLGISLVAVPEAGCCGAIEHHLNAHDAARERMRRQIDAWWPSIEGGVEAIVITASGCGTQVREYGHLLRDDPAYAKKAARVSALARDVGEVVAAEKDRLAALLPKAGAGAPIAYHSPCSLQHGQKKKGLVEGVLREAGFTLTAVPDAHLCCGSAGTYSILQPELSRQLLVNKVTALESGEPAEICTSNIGCLTHLGGGASKPVAHWIELLDRRLASA